MNGEMQSEIQRLFSLGLLEPLLQDKTTGGNILWATDAYRSMGRAYERDRQIHAELIVGENGNLIRTRAAKARETQSERTRQRAEVFTPLWICKKMNDHADAVLKERRTGKTDAWRRYVDARVLEITCGEAPYLVSRYDVSNGEAVDFEDRIGLLDRKLRAVTENTEGREMWMQGVKRAYAATYGYEFQGDNLLIARVNLLLTFEEAYQKRWNCLPAQDEYTAIISIIVYNLWQMDGLTGAPPYCAAQPEEVQLDIFSMLEPPSCEQTPPVESLCIVKDWIGKHTYKFVKMREGQRKMKFDFIIGNPPYQEETLGDNKGFAPPIYHKFIDASYKIADCVELIHPARFLFNGGSTPKQWNRQMLEDNHLKVLWYEHDASEVFSNTDIKGGVVITYHDMQSEFDPIEIFTPYEELNSILQRIKSINGFLGLDSISITSYAYHFTEKMHIDFPSVRDLQSKGHDYDLKSNIFDRLSMVFCEDFPNDGGEYIRILGRTNNERVYRYVRREYINSVANLDAYKVFLPKANGNGQLGEVLSNPMIVGPAVGHTETFFSIGNYKTQIEAENTLKYISTKFSRVLLSILKTTQNMIPDNWKFVPLQDFTPSSDIDWSQSIPDIDRQLYCKYGLSDEVIAFIESHVKEMA